jgi:hypothetical protein
MKRAALLLRWPIGLVLLATAAGKLLDVRGFAGVLRSYDALPDVLVGPLAVAVPLAELALAGWLFSGRGLAPAGLASAAMHAVYGAWSAAALARGLSLPNCGCFGVFLARPLTWRTVFEDAVMAVLSLALSAAATGRAR